MSLQALFDSDDAKAQLAILNDFRATLESTTDVETLDKLQIDGIPLLLRLLQETIPSYTSSSVVHQTRLSVLETIHRFSFNEAFKPQIQEVMVTILDLLKNDNEEIACVCLKIFIDLHKAYKTSIEEFVQPFLDIVLKLYQNMPDTVRESFADNNMNAQTARLARSVTSQSPQAANSPIASELQDVNVVTNKPLNASTKSFKVLTECPIIIVLLFSTYRQCVQTNLVAFTPAIIEMLSLKAPSLREASRAGRKQIFADFMLAQIKTLSFLAYVLRGFTAFMKKYATVIPQFVLHLLNECPPEMSAARKVIFQVDSRSHD